MSCPLDGESSCVWRVMKGLNLDWLYEEINMGGCGGVERGVYNRREWGSMYVVV